MRKRIFNVPAIISLILMGAVIVFWHRGYRLRESVELNWADWQGRLRVMNSRGTVAILWRSATSKYDFFVADEWPRLDRSHWQVWSTPQPFDWPGIAPIRFTAPAPNWRSFVGSTYAGGPGFSSVAFPIWWSIPFLSLLPARSVLVVARRHRRRATGLCQHCGYDLRYTPDRCPECGQAVHISEGPAATAPSA